MHRIENEGQLKDAPNGVWVDHRGYTWETEELGTLDFPAERLFTLRDAIFYIAEHSEDVASLFITAFELGVITPEEAIIAGTMGIVGVPNQEIIDAFK